MRGRAEPETKSAQAAGLGLIIPAVFSAIAAVFFLRSFLFEPFKIPSDSMLPTLQSGDLILVNKYTYGIRLPIINHKIISLNDPKRGDVMKSSIRTIPRRITSSGLLACLATGLFIGTNA